MYIVKSIDYFGKQFNFNVNGGTFKTFLGGIISLSIFLSTLVLACYFGIDIYLRKKPNFLRHTKYLQYYPLTKNHNYNDTLVAFRLTSEGYDDIRYIEHLVLYNIKSFDNITKTFDKRKELIKTSKCSELFYISEENILN